MRTRAQVKVSVQTVTQSPILRPLTPLTTGESDAGGQCGISAGYSKQMGQNNDIEEQWLVISLLEFNWYTCAGCL